MLALDKDLFVQAQRKARFQSLLRTGVLKMNLFRLAGDLSHLLAIIILLVKMWRTRSVAGKLVKLERKKHNQRTASPWFS